MLASEEVRLVGLGVLFLMSQEVTVALANKSQQLSSADDSRRFSGDLLHDDQAADCFMLSLEILRNVLIFLKIFQEK